MDFEKNWEEVQKYRKLINQNGIDGLYLHHPNKWVRRLIVKKIEDEDALKDFALNDSFHRVRLEAIRKISDEEFLAKIVFNEEEKYIKNLALKKIKDKSILENIALNHPSFNIRASLFDYISDDNTIWDLAKNDFYADIRKLAIEKINDNSLLYEIALSDSKKTVKRKAIIQMDDEDLLIKLRKEIEEDYSYLSPIIRERIRDIHMEMAKSSTDESVLIDLALNDPDSYVRDYAVENPHLNNQDVLEHLIFNDSNKMVRRQAVSKIKDDKVLIEVAQNDSDSWVRHSAVYNLDSSNQDIFIDIFYNDEDNDVKNVALLKIEDQNILKEQVENGDENRVYYAITNLEDEKLLMDTYKKYPYSKIQEKIIESPNLTDENFLEDIVLNEHWRLGVPALKRINDSSILANIAQKSSDQFLRKKAVKRIKDPDVLLELVYNSDDFDNVKRACENPNLSDESILKDIYNKGNFPAQLGVLKNPNFKDESLLLEVVKALETDISHETFHLALAAIENPNFPSEEILIKYATESFNSGDLDVPDYLIAELAASHQNLKDQAVLVDVAKHATRFEIRVAACENPNLVDDELLYDIMEANYRNEYYSFEWLVRKVCFKKIKDKSIVK